MKKSKLTTPIRLLLLLLCLAAAVPQLTAQTYTVAGAGINNGFLGTYWDPSDTINDMVRYGSTTYYYLSRTANVNSGDYAFKVVKNHSWDDASYPSNDYGYNVSDNGTWKIVYIFNTNGNNVSLTGPFQSLTVAGESDLVGSNWNPGNTECDMSSNDGIVYTLTQNNVNLTAGVHKFKVVANHSWDFQSWPGSDYELNINAAGTYDVTYSFNVITQEVSVTTTQPVIYYVKGDDTTIFPNGWNTGTNTAMTDIGDGTYSWESGQFHLTAGTSYAYKVWGDDGSWHPSGANATFSSNVQGNYTVTIYYDSNNGTVTHQLNLVQEDQSYTYNIRVRYTGSENLGNVYLHAWDAAGDKTNWPGTAFSGMTTTEENGHTYYCATITSYNQTLNLLFNENGSGDTKTTDLTAQPGTSYFTYGGGSTVSGPNQAADEADPTYDYTIYVRYKGNATPHEYLWDGAGTLLGDFPGKELTDASTFTTEVINGYTYYKYSVNASDYAQLGMILNEGDDSHKTTDLTVEPGTSYFTYGGGSIVSGPNADADPAITYYAESSFAGWTTEGTQMTANGDGSYSKTFTGVSLSSGTTYEYKVYGADGTDEGVWIGDNVTFTPPMGFISTVTAPLVVSPLLPIRQ